ncbi:MAG: histidine--tRNA ligase, partial [Halieaceae bacterium]|nr:histidine--tRNA ligase [Halieaceae bacterium]
AYVVAVGEAAQREALAAVEAVRDKLGELVILQHTGAGSFKSQLKKADKSGARVALIWGEDEVANGKVTIKQLRDQAAQEDIPGQQTVPREHLEATLVAAFADRMG